MLSVVTLLSKSTPWLLTYASWWLSTQWSTFLHFSCHSTLHGWAQHHFLLTFYKCNILKSCTLMLILYVYTIHICCSVPGFFHPYSDLLVLPYFHKWQCFILSRASYDCQGNTGLVSILPEFTLTETCECDLILECRKFLSHIKVYINLS